MDNTQYIALSRQTTLWNQLSVVGNNLANMNTAAYKKVDPLFSTYMAKTPSPEQPFGQTISYVQDFGIARDFENGSFEATGNSLDMAIYGDGFFVIDDENLGEVYSRSGHFKLDSNGMIVNSNGQPLMSVTDEPMFIAPNEKNISMTKDGVISTENGVVGQVKLVRFKDNQMMREYYGGLYGTDLEKNPPLDEVFATIEQGYIENSNVNAVEEITSMINVQRSYEAVQQMIEGESDRREKAMATFVKKGNQ